MKWLLSEFLSTSMIYILGCELKNSLCVAMKVSEVSHYFPRRLPQQQAETFISERKSRLTASEERRPDYIMLQKQRFVDLRSEILSSWWGREVNLLLGTFAIRSNKHRNNILKQSPEKMENHGFTKGTFLKVFSWSFSSRFFL